MKINSTDSTIDRILNKTQEELCGIIESNETSTTLHNRNECLRKPEKKYVIDGIRHPEVIIYLQSKFQANCKVIEIQATPKTRFTRSHVRNKPGDPQTLQEFEKADRIELGELQAPNTQRLAECLKLTEYTIENNGTQKELEEKLEDLFKKISYWQ